MCPSLCTPKYDPHGITGVEVVSRPESYPGEGMIVGLNMIPSGGNERGAGGCQHQSEVFTRVDVSTLKDGNADRNTHIDVYYLSSLISGFGFCLG